MHPIDSGAFGNLFTVRNALNDFRLPLIASIAPRGFLWMSRVRIATTAAPAASGASTVTGRRLVRLSCHLGHMAGPEL